MNKSVPQERTRPEAVGDEGLPSRDLPRPLPDFEPVSPIDREIARSERASAALAAVAAVARASFTDSQLEAEAAAAEAGEVGTDTGAWVRTEYASFDHSKTVRNHLDELGLAGSGHRAPGSSSANPVVGTFDPGLAALNAHAFPGSSITGGRPGMPQALFRKESRRTPRAEAAASGAARVEDHLAAGAVRYGKPEVMPMLATPTAAPRRSAAVKPAARASDPAKLMLAACMGAVVVLMAGGAAWKSGLLSTGGSPADRAIVTANVARQAEAARALGTAVQQMQTAPPAGGFAAAPAATTAAANGATTGADLDAILAAAARVAPVGVARVPVAVVPAATAPVPAPRQAQRTATLAAPVVTMDATPHAAPHGKDAVALAVANAQARADRFLASDASSAAVQPTATAVKR
jgi:hypothetical protein